MAARCMVPVLTLTTRRAARSDTAQSVGGLKDLGRYTGSLEFGHHGKAAFAVSGTTSENKIRRGKESLEATG
jgi:hypothetical protein